jgi:actin related protein 2/3 complex subunit 3
MVYHSAFTELPDSIQSSCGVPLLPLRTQTRGPAPKTTDFDIVDEAIQYFRPNVLFRKYAIQSDADKLLIYLTLYISQCLKRLHQSQKAPSSSASSQNNNNGSKKNMMTEGAKLLFALAHDHFDVTTGLGGIINGPKTFQEGETLKSYLAQCREEIGLRLIDHLYVDEGTKMNKFWMAFAKKKFMNKELPDY